MGNTCTPMADSCQCMAKPLQYCKVISLQLKYINLKKLKAKIQGEKKNRGVFNKPLPYLMFGKVHSRTSMKAQASINPMGHISKYFILS